MSHLGQKMTISLALALWEKYNSFIFSALEMPGVGIKIAVFRLDL